MTEARVHKVVWYAREDYPLLLKIMEDRHRLASTYDAWLASAEQVVGEVERVGVRVRRVTIRPDAFRAWCAVRGLALDGKARQQYIDGRD